MDGIRQTKILVAEDDRQVSQIIKTVLETNGYEVRTAYDGAKALAEVRSWQPELLILDVMLPIIDGFHICQTVNEDPSFNPKPKVLIVSSRGSDWDQNLGAACGAVDYLVKPLNNAEFLKKIKKIISTKNIYSNLDCQV